MIFRIEYFIFKSNNQSNARNKNKWIEIGMHCSFVGNLEYYTLSI